MLFPARKFLRAAAVASIMAGFAACNSFLDVTSTGELPAGEIKPETDGEIISRSAMQNLVDAFGNLIVNSAWFTNEARVGDTFPTRNEIGRRDINGNNGTHNDENWEPLQTAIASAEDAIRVLDAAGGLNAARSHWASGFGILLMAELFCQGTVKADVNEPAPSMDTNEMLDMAIQRLTRARELLATVSGDEDDVEEAANLATAALVGIARAHLFAGRASDAVAVANQVPADFVYNFPYVDDPANRGRLGNNVWSFTVQRLSLVVGPEFRAMADSTAAGPGDPRIAYDDAGRNAQDGRLRFFRQQKIQGWAAPIRFVSGLEARYIIQEAQADPAAMVTFINERRTVGKQAAFSSTNPDSIRTEFLNQYSRDFWLEARRLPAWRRNLNHMPFIIPPGDNYYKSGLGVVSDQTCWIVPLEEIDNNPRWNQ